MTVHPEDAAIYAADQHEALTRIGAALEATVDTERGTTRVSGVVVTREDRP